ncbi:MAG: acetyltransferase, partial [Hyphomicrobium sp.]
ISSITHTSTGATHQIFFIETSAKISEVNGYQVISEKEFFEIECNERYFNIAISDSRTRERIATECVAKGAMPMSIRSPHSIIYDCNEIGEGAIICAQAMITSNAKIGKFFHSNIYSYVAHDCIIGDYVTFAPNVHCNGNVQIHDHAYIGTDAVIKHGSPSRPLVIGEGAIVGMGAVVTKDVAPFVTVVGNPAKPHIKK